jgi:glycosyltransferase involved in cell wall biosynthesis
VGGALTIVLPAHNAGSPLVATARHVAAVVDRLAPEGGAVVVVDDGSTDGSVEELHGAMAAEPGAFARVEVLAHDRQRGKGAALRTGFAARPAAWMGFCDGDGDIDPDVLLELAAPAGLHGPPPPGPAPDAVCAVKTPRADLPMARRGASELFKLFRRVVLPLGIHDSQTGAKLFEGAALQAALPQLREEGFAFDLEALAALRAEGHGRFIAIPVQPRRVSTSSVTVRSALQLGWATLRVAARYRGRRGGHE